jgi:polar amino acid transport system substrate-binding protein
MTTRRRWCSAGLVQLAGLGIPAWADRASPIRAVGAQFARIHEGAEGQNPRGLAVDLLTQLFGDSIHFEWLPWPRAQLMVEQGDADLLVGPYRTPEREARLLFSLRAFYADAMIWYARRGEDYRWNGDLATLMQTPLAAMRGWAYGSRFERARSMLNQLNLVNTVESGLQMLTLRRVDLFAANERNCLPVLQRLGFVDALSRCSPPLDVLHGHMAFTRSAAGEELSRRFDQAFEAWIHSPAPTELYRRWGVERPTIAS